MLRILYTHSQNSELTHYFDSFVLNIGECYEFIR